MKSRISSWIWAMLPAILMLSFSTASAQVLPAPTNLTATASSDTQVDLTWLDNASNETGYTVERSLSSTSGFVAIAKLRSNKTGYRATRLTPATTYYFRVQATRKGYPASNYSNLASVRTLGNDLQPPTTPNGLVASVGGCTQIDLTWNPSTDTGVGLAGYQIYRNGSVVTSVPGTTYRDSAVAPNTTYSYNVSAFDQNGNYSPMSSAVSATTTGCGTVNLPPVSHAGADQVSETITLLTFDGSASNDPDGTLSSWSWSFGDGTTASGAVTTHAFATAGTYTVTLTVTDALGAASTDTLVATILNRPPVANAGLDLNGTAGQSVVLDGTSSRDLDGSVVGFAWSFGDGWGGSGATINHIYTTAGTYTVTLTVTDELGATGSDTTTVTVTSGPTYPNPPSNLIATPGSVSLISLTWSDNSTNEAGFKVERGTSATGPWSQIATTTSASWSDSGLASSTTYWYRVRAFNATGDSGYSNIASATTNLSIPLAPVNLTATAISSSQIALSWTDASSNETGFKIERAGSSSGPWTQVATSVAASWTDSGLAPATTFFYRVSATNAAGDSGYTPTVSATTSQVVPAAPSGLVATAVSSSQITVSWTDNSSNETGFKIERATSTSGPWTQVATPAASPWTDNGLASATTYFYRASATNAAGDSGYSNTASASTGQIAPAAPSALVATPISSSQITVSWTDNSSNETGFKIERATSTSGPWTQVATPAASPWTDSGLTSATTYFYRARATNAAGDSAYSNTSSAATFQVAPIAPSALVATPISSSQITVSWTDNSSNEAGFKVERATSTSGPWTLVATPAASPWTDSGLTSATTYFYRASATNAAGDSAYSNTSSAATFQLAPAAPSGLVATPASSSQINVSWTDNSSNETGFKVERATSTSGPWSQVGTTAATTFADTGLSAGTTYFYRARAYNAAGDSAYTNTSSAATFQAIPAAPTGLTTAPVSTTQITLSWTRNSSNESGFKVERAASTTAPFSQIGTTGAGVTSFSDSGLSASTSYTYRVRAFNTAGDSSFSNMSSSTTATVTQTGGAHVWSLRYGGQYGGLDYTSTQSMAADDAGNTYVAGYFLGSMDLGGGITINNGGGNDAFVAKYSSAGAVQWAKRLGGTASDIAYGVTTDGAGDVIVTGMFQTTADFGCGPMVNPAGGGSNVFVVKLSGSTGLCRWSKSFGGATGDVGYAVAVDRSNSNNDIVVTGSMSGSGDFGGVTLNGFDVTSYQPDVFIVKLNSSGQTIWAKGGIGSSAADLGRGVVVDRLGNILVTGEFLIGADFGAPTAPLTTGFYPDVFVVKYNSGGSPIWAKNYGSDLDQTPSDIAVDSANNILVTGWFRNSITFGCSGPAMSVPTGSSGMFLAKVNTDGTCVWQKSIQDTDWHRYPKVTVDSSDFVVLTGEAQNTVDAGGGPLTQTVANQKDAIIAKYSPVGDYQWSKRYVGTSTSRITDVLPVGSDVIFTGTIYGEETFGGSTLVNGTNNVAVGVLVRVGP